MLLTPLRVLVVDDDAGIRQLIAVNLELEGFLVTTAVDGQEGVDQAKAQLPDVITLDVMMPTLDGWEVTRLLRTDPTTQGIKVVLLSALGQDADRRRGAEVGVDAYLVKPFDPDELIAVIRQLAGRPQS